MTSYTADCSDCDFRIAKVPAQDWPMGTLRPLYIYRDQYPSVVTSFRGATWHPNNLQGSASQLEAWGAESNITGYIPQVTRLRMTMMMVMVLRMVMMMMIPIRSTSACCACPMINTFLHEIDESH